MEIFPTPSLDIVSISVPYPVASPEDIEKSICTKIEENIAGIESINLAVILTVWARFARMIRADVLGIKSMDFVTSAKIAGVSMPVIIWRHVFPNTVNTLMIITSLQVGQVILLEASLSFLGLGLPVGEPAWGIMVSEGKAVILDVWWLSLLPGLAITGVVLAFNYTGDWLRDALDPKLRRL